MLNTPYKIKSEKMNTHVWYTAGHVNKITKHQLTIPQKIQFHFFGLSYFSSQ